MIKAQVYFYMKSPRHNGPKAFRGGISEFNSDSHLDNYINSMCLKGFNLDEVHIQLP